MLRIFFVVMFLLFAVMAFCQSCPKDTVERFYEREQQVLYVYELKYVTSKGECVPARSFYVVLPGGRRILISKDVWEIVTGRKVSIESLIQNNLLDGPISIPCSNPVHYRTADGGYNLNLVMHPYRKECERWQQTSESWIRELHKRKMEIQTN